MQQNQAKMSSSVSGSSSTGGNQAPRVSARHIPLDELLRITGVSRVKKAPLGARTGQAVVPHKPADDEFRVSQGYQKRNLS